MDDNLRASRDVGLDTISRGQMPVGRGGALTCRTRKVREVGISINLPVP